MYTDIYYIHVHVILVHVFNVFHFVSMYCSESKKSSITSTTTVLLPPDSLKRQSSKRIVTRKINSAEKQSSVASCLSRHMKDEVCNECQSKWVCLCYHGYNN